MKAARLIMACLFGGAFGFATSRFVSEGNWGMVALTIGIFVAIFYLSAWIIDCK